MLKKILVILTLLLSLQTAWCQKRPLGYYNNLAIDANSFPPQLAHVEHWLKPVMGKLFYLQSYGYYKNGGSFQIVGPVDDIPIPGTGIRFTPVKVDSGGWLMAGEMNIISKSKITAYDQHFEYAKLNDPHYMYGLVMDYYYPDTKYLVHYCLTKFETGANATPNFINKLSAYYKVKITPADMAAYKYYQGQVLHGVHDAGEAYYTTGTIERSENEQLLMLIDEKILFGGRLNDFIYDTYIKGSTAKASFENATAFFKLIGLTDYQDVIYKILEQHFTLTRFPAKVYFDNGLLQPVNGQDAVYFDVTGIAEFKIVPSDNGWRFDMVFNGTFNGPSATKNHEIMTLEEHYQTLYISINSTHVIAQAWSGSGKKLEIYNEANSLTSR